MSHQNLNFLPKYPNTQKCVYEQFINREKNKRNGNKYFQDPNSNKTTIHNQKEKEKSKPYRKSVSKNYKLKKRKKKTLEGPKTHQNHNSKHKRKIKLRTIQINIIYTTNKTQQTLRR